MQKIKIQNKNGFILINILALIIVALFVVVLGYFAQKKLITKTDSPNSPSSQEISEVQTPEDRDSLRKKHATTLASRLFAMRYINNKSPGASQAGFDSIAIRDSQDPLIDPLTKRPYIFSEEQSGMNVGEATFKLDATCDNKVSGSNGIGLITSTASESVAVAIKLESGDYACDSNL